MVLPSLAIDKQTCERAGHSGALDMMRCGGVAANPSARRRECARVSIPRAGLAPARPVQPADLPCDGWDIANNEAASSDAMWIMARAIIRLEGGTIIGSSIARPASHRD